MKRRVLVINDESNLQLNQLVHLMSGLVRKEKLEGKEHLIVPTILIVEGVHNGLFYPAEEISKFPEAWDGRPVVLWHPTENGKAKSANSPKVLESSTVGKLFNTRFDNGKLKSEVWIDISKADTFADGKSVLNMLKKNKHIEVSTGLYLEENGEEGEWKGEKYKATVVNYRPDHLALLPGGQGACSWKDGAGMPRLNQAEDIDITILEGMEINAELSHEDIRRDLSNQIQKKVKVAVGQPYPCYPYICEVYDSYLVYEMTKEGKTKYFKQTYSVTENKVALEGNPVEVSKVVSYEAVEAVTKNTSDEQKTSETSTNKAKGGKMRKDKVAALIANEASGWKVEDTEFLTALSDEQFEKIEKLSQTKEAVPTPQPKPELNADPKKDEDEEEEDEEKKPAANEKPQTIDEYIANAPEGMRDTLRRSYTRDQEIKANIVKGLTANSHCSFTKEQLEGMDIQTLEKMSKLAQVDVDFSGNAGGLSINASGSKEVLEVPTMNFKKETK